MNVKLVKLVVAMSALSLVSPYAIAKHKVHHHVRHHRQMEVVHEYHEYKDAMPVEPTCTISQTTMILDQTTQNMGRSLPSQCNPGWFNRVSFSGGMNIDLGKWGNRNAGYTGENYQRLSLNDVYLNVAADVNEWAKAFASVSYNSATSNFEGFNVGTYSAAYNNIFSGFTSNGPLQLEQAYATIANFDQSPFYLQLGKQFQDFSRYETHPITRSLTQTMSETLATSAKVGVILPSGFSGDLYLFDDPIPKFTKSSRPTNYGISLSYEQPGESAGFDVGLGYLYNIIGANDVAYAVQSFTNVNGYHTRVGGFAAYGDVNVGPFVLSARYTTATQRFNALDLPSAGLQDLTVASPGLNVVSPTAKGSKPWTAGVQAAYGFEAWGKTHSVYAAYQSGRQTAGLFLPKNRWLLGFGCDVVKYTNFGIEWDHDIAYSTNAGGNGKNTNLVSLRATIKYS